MLMTLHVIRYERPALSILRRNDVSAEQRVLTVTRSEYISDLEAYRLLNWTAGRALEFALRSGMEPNPAYTSALKVADEYTRGNATYEDRAAAFMSVVPMFTRAEDTYWDVIGSNAMTPAQHALGAIAVICRAVRPVGLGAASDPSMVPTDRSIAQWAAYGIRLVPFEDQATELIHILENPL